MPTKELQYAKLQIEKIQSLYESLRKETYHSVHDMIGSTLSAASIKMKLLSEKITDPTLQHQAKETHQIIRETMEHITSLNRKLKTGWIPQSTETLFDDLSKEFEKVQTLYGIEIQFEISNREKLKKLSFVSLNLIYQSIQKYIYESVPRLASSILVNVQITENNLKWNLSDSSPISTPPLEFSIPNGAQS